MLTIQPKISTVRPVRQITFKSEGVEVDNDINYEEKTKYYKKQIQECDDIINDKETPEYLKNFMKGFKIISQALLDGWLVAFGASKSSKIVKSSVIKSSESGIIKSLKKCVKPLTDGISSLGRKFVGFISNGYKNLKETKFMKENAFGQFLTTCFDAVGEKFNKWFAPMKNKSASEIYDKAAKATSATLGTGAGVAGAYNAATDADKKTETKKDDETSDEDEIDEVEDDD